MGHEQQTAGHTEDDCPAKRPEKWMGKRAGKQLLRRLKTRKRPALYGFPVRLEQEYAGRLLKKKIPIVIIKETDRYIGRIKERLPFMKMMKKEE